MVDFSARDPQEILFFAIAFTETPGVATYIDQIDEAVAAGADLNGFSKDGETPLTSAILGGTGSPKAVKRLLALGADPNVRDKTGWTPWTACVSQLDNPVVADNMQEIRKQLAEHAADRSDEILLDLQKAANDGDKMKVEELLGQGVDLNSPIISPLAAAIENEDLSMMELLFTFSADPEGSDPETHLMTAAGDGKFAVAKRLVAAGADVSRYAWDDKQCTAEFYALENGYTEIAEWLSEYVPEDDLAERKKALESRNPKFAALYENHTNGCNYGFQTDDVCRMLEKWDSLYTVQVSDVAHDRVLVAFESLPEELADLIDEIDDFCPDVIGQHFDCLGDVLDMMDEAGQEIPPEIAELVEGVDLDDENAGKLLLGKSLQRGEPLALWWD